MRLTINQLTEHWLARYSIEPRAHQLRSSCSDRWLRIHGLPDLKRYPDTPEEYTVILHRHNEVLSALLTTGTPAILITTGWSCAESPSPVQDEALQHSDARHWMTVPMDSDDPQSILWHLYAREVAWQRGVFDTALRRTANGECVNVMVLGITQRIAFHPYDGGADIIARDECQRDLLRAQFREWLSPLPSGL